MERAELPRGSVLSSAALTKITLAFLGLVIGILLDGGLFSAIGLALVFFSAAWYFSDLGDEIAIVPLAAFIASVQWILGPIIAYHEDEPYYKYGMYIAQTEYMSYVVPALFAFVFSLAWIAPRITIARLQKQIFSSGVISDKVIVGLLLLGFSAEYSAIFVPDDIAFIFFLLSQFKYIAAMYIIVYRWRFRWQLMGSLLLLEAISSAETGMFHDLILWSTIVLTYFCYDFRLKVPTKIAILVASVGLLVGLQTVKVEYRNILRDSPEAAGLITLASAIRKAATSGNDAETVTDNTVRLNQGWIISAVMANTPINAPFANGETIIDAIRDSFLPRFLIDKREAVVSNNFRRFTGLEVGTNTSFGISLVGEGWANFGYFGVALMLGWGVTLGLVMKYIAWRSIAQPTFALWTPLMFLYAVKAETELLVTLNHMVKAGIFVILIYIFMWKVLKVRI